MKIELKLKPFLTPNCVQAEKKGSQFERGEGPTFVLKDISAEALSDLCDKFRSDVFAKAMKQDPKIK